MDVPRDVPDNKEFSIKPNGDLWLALLKPPSIKDL
jgi:hypothetical protein